MNFAKTLTAAAAAVFTVGSAQAMTTVTDYDYFCIETPYDAEMNTDETAQWVRELASLFNTEVDITRDTLNIQGAPHTAFKIEFGDSGDTAYLLHSTSDNMACEMDKQGYDRALGFKVAP